MRYEDYARDMDEADNRADRLTAKILKLQREKAAQAARIAELEAALREIVAKHEAPEPPEPYDPSMTAEEIAIEEAEMAEYREGCTGAYATCARIARRALEPKP